MLDDKTRFVDTRLWSEVARSVSPDTARNILKYREAAGIIADGITLANSIDDFLNIHSNNPHVIELGKAGIIRVILKAEEDSSLRIDPSIFTTSWTLRR